MKNLTGHVSLDHDGFTILTYQTFPRFKNVEYRASPEKDTKVQLCGLDAFTNDVLSASDLAN